MCLYDSLNNYLLLQIRYNSFNLRYSENKVFKKNWNYRFKIDYVYVVDGIPYKKKINPRNMKHSS